MTGSVFARIAGHRALPVLVATLGACLSLGAWAHLIQERRTQIDELAREVAAQSRRTVANSVRNHIRALRDLAGFWAIVGRRPVEEWRAEVDLLIESYPNLAYVAWIYPDGRSARVAPGKFESPASVGVQPGEARQRAQESAVIGPERDEQGKLGFRVYLPVRRGATDLGVLETRINLQPLLAEVLEESAPGYAIRIHWNDQEIFRRGEPSDDARLAWWHEQGIVALPFDVKWTMTHAPTPDLTALWLTAVPHYLLAVGLLLAAALGVLADQLRATFLRARFLAAGNLELQASAGELRRLNEALEARVAERTSELEAFNHSISHDLKSPLGAILNFASILEADYRERLDRDALDVLTRIRRSATRGLSLLEGLLRLSRAGHAALQNSEIDMERLARESFAQARVLEANAHIEFALEPLPRARGDRTLIGEVLVNLFDNAIKYSRGREKRRVAVAGHIESGVCVYEVSDNGQGFDMRYADKLFGLFERLHASQDIEGTGVGLAMAQRIVTRHGGRIWAEGKPDEGARFTFTLPWGESEAR